MIDGIFSMMLSAAGVIKNTSGMTYETQQAVLNALIILMAVAAIALIVIVLMQQGTNDNIGIVGGASDTYYGRNKAQTKEGRLKKVTLGLFVFLLLTSMVYFLVALVNTGQAAL